MDSACHLVSCPLYRLYHQRNRHPIHGHEPLYLDFSYQPWRTRSSRWRRLRWGSRVDRGGVWTGFRDVKGESESEGNEEAEVVGFLRGGEYEGV